MTICISCGLETEKVDEKSKLEDIRKSDDGTLHWKECHNVGGKIKAGFLYD